jgi:putative tryptophan/tyrosine transport system substrate-binding protein
MRRRELLYGLFSLLGNAVFWPLAVRAQQALPVIGFLHSGSSVGTRPEVSAFSDGTKQAGFVEHSNLAVEYRWAEGRDELLADLATDLVRRDVAIIVAGGGDNAVIAAKRATASIPIVFVSGSDPVRSGFVANPDHPGGNVTGVSLADTELLAKRLEILHALAPQVTSIVALVNPDNPNMAVQLQYLNDEAARISVSIAIANAYRDVDLGPALDRIAQHPDAALLVANDGFLNSQRDRLLALTTRYAIAAAFGNREFVEAGGLMSYGPSLLDAYRQAGIYAGRILKGEKPADLPIANTVAFELVINAKTARSLGLKISPALLTATDGVIE